MRQSSAHGKDGNARIGGRCFLRYSIRPPGPLLEGAEPSSGDMVSPTAMSQDYPSEDRLNGPTNSPCPGRGDRRRRTGSGSSPTPFLCGLLACTIFLSVPLAKGTGGIIPRLPSQQDPRPTPAPGRQSCLSSSHAELHHPGL